MHKIAQLISHIVPQRNLIKLSFGDKDAEDITLESKDVVINKAAELTKEITNFVKDYSDISKARDWAIWSRRAQRPEGYEVFLTVTDDEDGKKFYVEFLDGLLGEPEVDY